MARRRRRRNKVPGDRVVPDRQDGEPVTDNLSPRARRLVESGVIDPADIDGTGEDGRVTSGDILLAARVIEKERSIPRIEAVNNTSTTTGAVDATVDPPAVEPSPWDAYNGTSEGLAGSALHGAEQSWGEAEALLADGGAFGGPDDAVPPEDEPAHPEPVPIGDSTQEAVASEMEIAGVDWVIPEPESVEPSIDLTVGPDEPEELVASVVSPPESEPEIEPETVAVSSAGDAAPEAGGADDEIAVEPGDGAEPEVKYEPAAAEPVAAVSVDLTEQVPALAEAPLNFGTLEMVDPDRVWEEGADNFAPWFLAHSTQLADVLGIPSGLADARLYTTKSATGVIGIDQNGDEVVVVSTERSVAEDGDLGRALGMVASSGASSIALISAKFREEQLQALSWLNNQTKSGVRWYGVETQAVRIGDSPVAMLFDLVAAPPEPAA